MAFQRELAPRLALVNDGRDAILRIRKSDRDKLEKHLFQRYPHREWGTFLRFGFRRTSWGLALSFIDSVLPEPGDLDRQSDVTVFRDQYSLRAMRVAERREVAVGVAHSHPVGFGTSPSPLDDDMDAYFARELAAYSGGFPYVSLIFQRSDETGFTFSGRVYDRGEWLPVTTMFTIGEVVEKEFAEHLQHGEESEFDELGTEKSTTARLDQLFGVQAARRLRNARVGVAGCSGTGSPAIEVLARANVGAFVLVDPQRLAPSNVERVHGTVFADTIREPLPYKVEIQQRHIAAINPSAKVTSMVGNVLHENVLDELLRCDVVLGCTDSVHGRVLLSDVAKHYLLPSIDVGVAMNGRHGKLSNQTADVTSYGPDRPCAFCNGLVDTAAMAAELMTEEERRSRQAAAKDAAERGDNPDHYWRGERQLHTVGYLTSAVGSLAAGYVEAMLTGAFKMPHAAFQFDIGQPHFAVVPTLPCDAGCSCRERIGWSDQARSFRNVARPRHWPSLALLIDRDAAGISMAETEHGPVNQK